MAIAQVTCRHCASTTEPGDYFCRGCGAKLGASNRLRNLVSSRPVIGGFSNPLVKAEAVLVCALSFFVVSSAVWVGNSLKISKLSKRELAASRRAVAVNDLNTESEIDRLLKQAKTLAASPATSIVAATSVSLPVQAGVPVPTAAKIAAKVAIPVVETAAVVPATPSFIKDSVAKDSVAKDPVWLESTASEAETAPVVAAEKVTPARLQASRPALTFKFEEASEPATQTKPIAKPKPAKITPSKIDDLARYNRLLAGYFAKNAATTDGAAPGGALSEPVTYEEWLAAGKPDL